MLKWVDANPVLIDLIALLASCFTVIGVGIGVWQLIRTTSSVRAANTASAKLISAVSLGFSQHTLSNAHRLLNELRIHIDNEAWKMAAVRSGDLADQLAGLVHAEHGNANKYVEACRKVRTWQHTFSEVDKENQKWSKPLSKKWSGLSYEVSSLIDEVRTPLATANNTKAES